MYHEEDGMEEVSSSSSAPSTSIPSYREWPAPPPPSPVIVYCILGRVSAAVLHAHMHNYLLLPHTLATSRDCHTSTAYFFQLY